MSRVPRRDVPTSTWQQSIHPEYGASGLAGSQYDARGNVQHGHHNEDAYRGGFQPGQPSQTDFGPPVSLAPPLPAENGMRIRGAAGSDLGLRIQGAAGRDQSQDHSSPALSQTSKQRDSVKPGPAPDSRSRSSTRGRSSSTSDQLLFIPRPADKNNIMEKKDQQIKEQQQFINRLTSENQSLSANVKGLTEAKDRMHQRVEQREKELQQVAYRDPELSRRRDEFFVDQGRQVQESQNYVNDLRAQVRRLGEVPMPAPDGGFVRSSSTRDLQGIEEPDDDADSDDDLSALNFPDDDDVRAATWATPVERRIQALGATMDDNDRAESQQPIIVSRHLRPTSEGDQGSWNRPVGQTKYWSKVKDDPAFAVVGEGPPVSFELLIQRIKDIPSIINMDEDPRYQPAWPPDDNRDDVRYAEPQYHSQRHVSYDQEERLAALRVSGDPKPVKAYTPKNARGRTRSRSRSPQYLGPQRDERDEYRQRGYESYHPRRQSVGELRDNHRDEGNAAGLDVPMGHETARNIGAKFGHGQQNQNKRKGKGQGKNNQYQQQQSRPNPQYQHRYPQNHNPQQHRYDQQDWENSGVSQGQYDQRRNPSDYY